MRLRSFEVVVVAVNLVRLVVSFVKEPVDRMAKEVAPRPLDVQADLVGQLQGGAELLLAPQQLVEVQPHRVTVDVRIEVEDVALDGRGVVLVERWADADVRDALEGAAEALEARGGDVDAVARK